MTGSALSNHSHFLKQLYKILNERQLCTSAWTYKSTKLPIMSTKSAQEEKVMYSRQNLVINYIVKKSLFHAKTKHFPLQTPGRGKIEDDDQMYNQFSGAMGKTTTERQEVRRTRSIVFKFSVRMTTVFLLGHKQHQHHQQDTVCL